MDSRESETNENLGLIMQQTSLILVGAIIGQHFVFCSLPGDLVSPLWLCDIRHSIRRTRLILREPCWFLGMAPGKISVVFLFFPSSYVKEVLTPNTLECIYLEIRFLQI